MRFRTTSTTPQQIDARLQRRLLGYVAVIAVVMLVFQLFAAKPQPAILAPVVTEPNPQDQQVREQPRRPLEADEFFSEPSPPEGRNLAATPQPQADGISIDPHVLAAIEDNTLGIRRHEAPAFFDILDKARQIPVERLEAAAEPGLQRLNLMTDPAAYRGKPVTLVGEMRRVHEFPASDNEYGLKTLYEAWVFTADSANRPFRVVCSRLAPEFTQAGAATLPAPVRVTGYFFKREGYESPGGLQVAPTILASRIDPYVSANAPPRADGLWPIMMGVIVAAGLILATTLVSFAWSDRRLPSQRGKLPDFNDEIRQRLAAHDQRSVRDQLRELEERELYGDHCYQPPSVAEAAYHAANGRVQGDAAPIDLPTPPPPTRYPRSGGFGESSEPR